MPLTNGIAASVANYSQHGLVFIAGRVAIGASGAVGAKTGKGFAVTRTGTGLYTITLDGVGGVVAIVNVHVDVIHSSGAATQSAYALTIVPGTRIITLQTVANSAPSTAADPPNGSSLQLFVVALTQ